MNLADVDLQATICPRGLAIEIQGYDALEFDLPNESLLTAIAHVYVIRSGKSVPLTIDLLRKITILELDVINKFIKVAIAS